MADVKREKEPFTSKGLAKFVYSLNFGYDPEKKIAELEARVEQLEVLLRGLVKGIDDWNEDVQKVIGYIPDYHWGTLEEARRALPDLKKAESDD